MGIFVGRLADESRCFFSLLALDAYNRGYDESLFPETRGNGALQNEAGRKIGNATVLFDANDPEGIAQAAGFYAIAYELPDELVISYRGTSFNNGFDETTLLDAATG